MYSMVASEAICFCFLRLDPYFFRTMRIHFVRRDVEEDASFVIYSYWHFYDDDDDDDNDTVKGDQPTNQPTKHHPLTLFRFAFCLSLSPLMFMFSSGDGKACHHTLYSHEAGGRWSNRIESNERCTDNQKKITNHHHPLTLSPPRSSSLSLSLSFRRLPS